MMDIVHRSFPVLPDPQHTSLCVPRWKIWKRPRVVVGFGVATVSKMVGPEETKCNTMYRHRGNTLLPHKKNCDWVILRRTANL